MADTIEIPEIKKIDGKRSHEPNSPGWIRIVDTTGKSCKPIIRCNCGMWCGIGLHHVHPDGTVTASFYHKRGTDYTIGESPDGCEWHVYLKLKDYSLGEFLPEK